jgi:hypothetical protein
MESSGRRGAVDPMSRRFNKRHGGEEDESSRVLVEKGMRAGAHEWRRETVELTFHRAPCVSVCGLFSSAI